MKKMIKESTIEGAFLRKMKSSGIKNKVKKMNGEGSRSWPDRAILVHPGITLFIEFKRPGQVPTELQADTHEELRALGFQVEVFDDAQKAFEWTVEQINRAVNRSRK